LFQSLTLKKHKIKQAVTIRTGHGRCGRTRNLSDVTDDPCEPRATRARKLVRGLSASRAVQARRTLAPVNKVLAAQSGEAGGAVALESLRPAVLRTGSTVEARLGVARVERMLAV